MAAWILLLIIVAITLGIIGAVVHGLLYLLVIGVLVFLVALLPGGMRVRSMGRRRQR